MLEKKISIIVPVFNEQSVIRSFHERLSIVLGRLNLFSEVIYINDGSTDDTKTQLKMIRSQDSKVAILNLSRNFGKEIAVTAGLDYSNGDAVIIIDADLQDPPELIFDFVKWWEQGYDVVYGKRESRAGDPYFKKITAFCFYRIMRLLCPVSIPVDTGDFRLLSRKAVDALKQIKEHSRFMKGLYAWIGFPQKAVLYNRDARFLGKTKWNYWRLWNFAIDGVASFSMAPLRVASYIGLLISLMSFLYGMIIISKTLLFGEVIKGYPSLMTVILFLGGIQLMVMGIIGEYIGRIFNEVKMRPLYFIESYEPVDLVSELKQPAFCGDK